MIVLLAFMRLSKERGYVSWFSLRKNNVHSPFLLQRHFFAIAIHSFSVKVSLKIQCKFYSLLTTVEFVRVPGLTFLPV